MVTWSLGAFPSLLHQMIKMPRDGGILTIHGDADRETAVLEVKDDNAGLHLTGFQFFNAIEKVPLDLDPYANHYVVHMMKEMEPFIALTFFFSFSNSDNESIRFNSSIDGTNHRIFEARIENHPLVLSKGIRFSSTGSTSA